MNATLVSPLLAAGGLTDIDRGVFIFTFVAFVVFAWLLKKVGWGPLLGLIEERERSIREAVEGSEKANAEAKELLEKHRALLRDAAHEREEIVKKAVDEAERVKAGITEQARAEGDKLLGRAREQIEREKTAAIQELRAQVADIAIEAASKIVTSSLDAAAQRRLVDDFVDQLPRSGRAPES